MERPQERLQRQKLGTRIGRPQMVDTVPVAILLDAHAHPGVRRPWEVPTKLFEPLGTLGEHLEAMPMRAMQSRRTHDE